MNRSHIIVVLFLVLLNGCTFRFIYNHSDTVFLWRIDDFLDLTREQERFLKPRIMAHVRWHRDNEVQSYIDFLKELQNRIRDQVSAEDLQWFYASLRPFRAHLGRQLQQDAVMLFATVNKRQIEHLKEELADGNEEFVERLAMTPEKRLANKVDGIVDKLEKWTGSLSSEQERQIAALMAHVPDVTDDWLTYRRGRQQEFVQLVQQASEGTAVEAALYEWFTRSRPEKFRDFYDATDAMVLSVDKLLTEKQRQHVIAEIQEWIDDMTTVLTRATIEQGALAGEH